MKTKKVRIALVINSEGDWSANGWADMEDWSDSEIDIGDEHAEARYWIEVEVPVPASWDHEVLTGTATKADEAA
jgi:hypothetical protein